MIEVRSALAQKYTDLLVNNNCQEILSWLERKENFQSLYGCFCDYCQKS